jgi:hypothetical protein
MQMERMLPVNISNMEFSCVAFYMKSSVSAISWKVSGFYKTGYLESGRRD